MSDDRARLTGVALVLLSALAWSLNGLYTRFLTVDLWTTLVGRGIATAGLLFLILILTRGRRTGEMLAFNLRHGGVVIVAGAVTILSFVAALFNTTVANVTVIYSVSPLAAVLARLLIGDPLVARTLVAYAIAVSGVVLMVGGSLGTNRLFGDLLALLMAASFAVVIVEMRRKPQVDNVTASMLTSLLIVLALLPFASFAVITPTDAIVLFLFGFTSNILGFFLFIAGVRRLPPAEAGLIATLEIILAPFWVWLFFAEDPGGATIAGGIIVLAAIVFQLSGELRRVSSPAVASRSGTGAGAPV